MAASLKAGYGALRRPIGYEIHNLNFPILPL
jgi:hypothetical protein